MKNFGRRSSRIILELEVLNIISSKQNKTLENRTKKFIKYFKKFCRIFSSKMDSKHRKKFEDGLKSLKENQETLVDFSKHFGLNFKQKKILQTIVLYLFSFFRGKDF